MPLVSEEGVASHIEGQTLAVGSINARVGCSFGDFVCPIWGAQFTEKLSVVLHS